MFLNPNEYKKGREMIHVVLFKAALIKHYGTCIHLCITGVYDKNLLLKLGYRFKSWLE